MDLFVLGFWDFWDAVTEIEAFIAWAKSYIVGTDCFSLSTMLSCNTNFDILIYPLSEGRMECNFDHKILIIRYIL